MARRLAPGPRWVILAVVVLATTACGVFRPDQALRVATGVAAHDLCSETFVSGLDPDRVFAESLAPRPGFGLVSWTMFVNVDRERREVRTSLAGLLSSRAVYREGWGCMLVHGNEVAALPAPVPIIPSQALLPPIASQTSLLAPVNARLKAAIDAAFLEPSSGPPELTKAVVVLRDGRVVGERYAPGYNIDTPVLGFSIAKSVINALLGVLVQQGRLDAKGPAPIAVWQGASDPRRAITVEQLMRMTSGLDLDETGSGFDPANRMFYVEGDMAGFAQAAKLKVEPGTRWFYSSAGTHLLARMVRDKTGGSAAAMQRFAAEQLFGPLGMRSVVMETDITGTPVGAHYMFATARDWARFGSLYLNDGVVGGRRLLPEGWVAFSNEPTLETNYGAGWWPNRTNNPGGARVSKLDMPLMRRLPPDAFYALGNLGQYILVVPSERLVVVRLGRSQAKSYDCANAEALVVAAIAAFKDPVP